MTGMKKPTHLVITRKVGDKKVSYVVIDTPEKLKESDWYALIRALSFLLSSPSQFA